MGDEHVVFGRRARGGIVLYAQWRTRADLYVLDKDGKVEVRTLDGKDDNRTLRSSSETRMQSV